MGWCGGMPDFWLFFSSLNWGDNDLVVFSASRAPFLRHSVYYIHSLSFRDNNLIFFISLENLSVPISQSLSCKDHIISLANTASKKLDLHISFMHAFIVLESFQPTFCRVFKCGVVQPSQQSWLEGNLRHWDLLLINQKELNCWRR